MGGEPQICVLPEHRGKGYGISLMKGYLNENELIGGNKYVFYKAVTEDGLAFIKRFKDKEPDTYKVIEVGINKYIILRDFRID